MIDSLVSDPHASSLHFPERLLLALAGRDALRHSARQNSGGAEASDGPSAGALDFRRSETFSGQGRCKSKCVDAYFEKCEIQPVFMFVAIACLVVS